MGLNSSKYQRNFHFKKHMVDVQTKQSGITIKPYVKLLNVWFSKEQNQIVCRMFTMTFIIGLIIGILVGILI